MKNVLVPTCAAAFIMLAMSSAQAQVSATQEPEAAHPAKQTASGSSAVYVTTAVVQEALQQLSPKFTDDEPIRVLDAGTYNLGVFVVGRPNVTGAAQKTVRGSTKVTEGLQLDQVAAIVRILDGTGILVTGGVLDGAARIAADDPDLPVIGPGKRGKAISGGRSSRVGAGDMVIIPAGVAHGFSQIDTPMTYLVIRVDAGKVLPLK